MLAREAEDESASPVETSEESMRIEPLIIDIILHEQDEDEENFDTTFTSKEKEYLHWHTKLGHLGKSKMQQTSSQNHSSYMLSWHL